MQRLLGILEQFDGTTTRQAVATLGLAAPAIRPNGLKHPITLEEQCKCQRIGPRSSGFDIENGGPGTLELAYGGRLRAPTAIDDNNRAAPDLESGQSTNVSGENTVGWLWAHAKDQGLRGNRSHG